MTLKTVLIERMVNYGTFKKPDWKLLSYMQTSSLYEGKPVPEPRAADTIGSLPSDAAHGVPGFLK